MKLVHAALIVLALIATVYFTGAFVGGLETDAYIAAVVGICALGGAVLVEHYEQERRRRLAAGHARVWRRRDDEAGLR